MDIRDTLEQIRQHIVDLFENTEMLCDYLDEDIGNSTSVDSQLKEDAITTLAEVIHDAASDIEIEFDRARNIFGVR